MFSWTAGPTTRKRKNPPHSHIASPPKRTRVDTSSLIINGELERFQSGGASFSAMLMQNNRAYFDRTRYISVLEDLHNCILFCRPRRFGKSLTISMLEPFHGLQYADQHQTCYKVCQYISLITLTLGTYFSFNQSRVSMYKTISTETTPPQKIYKSGQYFVLKFDFSTINASPDPAETNQRVITRLNSSIKKFYQTYAVMPCQGTSYGCGP
jgi:hypothetical protein